MNGEPKMASTGNVARPRDMNKIVFHLACFGTTGLDMGCITVETSAYITFVTPPPSSLSLCTSPTFCVLVRAHSPTRRFAWGQNDFLRAILGTIICLQFLPLPIIVVLELSALWSKMQSLKCKPLCNHSRLRERCVFHFLKSKTLHSDQPTLTLDNGVYFSVFLHLKLCIITKALSLRTTSW